MRLFISALLLAALAACAQEPLPATPAIWHVKDSHGHQAWLFGTIHSSDSPINWQSPAVAKAFKASDTTIVEVGNLADEKAVSTTFAMLAKADGKPPLSERISPHLRPALAALLERGGYDDDDFTAIDTWAAALMLARVGVKDETGRNGVDRAILAASGDRRVVELEGAERQLGLFDGLPEKEQRDLLEAVVEGKDVDGNDLSESWRKGDMIAIERETQRGLLADPELRTALFTNRNREWTQTIIVAMQQGQRPFVAVGAAHMAGTEGLPAMLALRGYTVTRIQ